jgi:hypothetical protein
MDSSFGKKRRSVVAKVCGFSQFIHFHAHFLELQQLSPFFHNHTSKIYTPIVARAKTLQVLQQNIF